MKKGDNPLDARRHPPAQRVQMNKATQYRQLQPDDRMTMASRKQQGLSERVPGRSPRLAGGMSITSRALALEMVGEGTAAAAIHICARNRREVFLKRGSIGADKRVGANGPVLE